MISSPLFVTAFERFLELANGLAQRLADLGKPLGAKEEQDDDEKEKYFRKPDPSHMISFQIIIV